MVHQGNALHVDDAILHIQDALSNHINVVVVPRCLVHVGDFIFHTFIHDAEFQHSHFDEFGFCFIVKKLIPIGIKAIEHEGIFTVGNAFGRQTALPRQVVDGEEIAVEVGFRSGHIVTLIVVENEVQGFVLRLGTKHPEQHEEGC